MKKFITLFLTFVLLLALPTLAGAEKEKFKSGDFDFKKVKSVAIASVGTREYTRATYKADFGMEDKVYTALEGALAKRHLKVASAAKAVRPNLKIKVIINALGTYTEHKAAWDETTTVDKKEVGKDENGNDVVVTVPTQETVHHPAEDISHAVAELEMVATDVRTGKDVYRITDSRERSSETDTSGMLHRICTDFAKDITRD